MALKSKRSKACDISPATKSIVWERDEHKCIFCGSLQAAPNAHYIPRSQGGLGIEQNVVTLCIKCHHAFDNGNSTELRNAIRTCIVSHLKQHYPDWDEKNLIYRK